jgi:methionyl-tRNA formyltransferase
MYRGKTVKIRAAAPRPGDGTPGTLSLEKGEGLVVQCRIGRLLVRRLQPEGKKDMDAADFWNGVRPQPGDKFE